METAGGGKNRKPHRTEEAAENRAALYLVFIYTLNQQLASAGKQLFKIGSQHCFQHIPKTHSAKWTPFAFYFCILQRARMLSFSVLAASTVSPTDAVYHSHGFC